MAARPATKLMSLAFFLGALLAQPALVLAQSATPSNHTAGLGEIITAVTATEAKEPAPTLQRKVLYPNFSQRLDSLFVELLQRPSALSPEPLSTTTGPSAQGLTTMLDRTRQPDALRQASAPAVSFGEVVTQSLSADAAGLQPPYGSEFGRRRALVDALRTAVPSDGDVMR